VAVHDQCPIINLAALEPGWKMAGVSFLQASDGFDGYISTGSNVFAGAGKFAF
jgi:hypothetical protein